MTLGIEVLCKKGLEGLGSAVEILINEAMKIERAKHINAKLYERTEMRSGYSNGFKPKQLNTRLGTLNLQIPQVRDSSFYPSFLERGLRSERALILSLAEMYIQGVSTRKVSRILEEMCGFEVSSQDVSRASKLLDEEFIKWRTRPLGRYEYLILDARYEKVRQGGQVLDSAPEGLTVFNFKTTHRIRLRTTNLAERVNREIKRRTNIVNIFPNVESCERLITGVLIEISESWGNEPVYLSMKE